jgi:uncharacterized Zn-binding protein involved in type VI secretion
MKQTLLALVALAVCLVAPALMKADSSAFVGTWKLNLEKSKYPPNAAPKSMMRTVTADGDKVTYSFEGTAADGSAIKYSFTVQYDGKDNAISGSGPFGADHVALKLVNSHMTEGTLKKGDKVVSTVHTTVSHDGKMATISGKGTDPDGKPIKQTQVYDKQ